MNLVSKKLFWILIMVTLSFISIYSGIRIFKEYNYSLFSHDIVSWKLTFSFVGSLIVASYIFGYYINLKSIKTVLSLWPFVHISLLFFAVILESAILFFIAVVPPINCFGEVVSIGIILSNIKSFKRYHIFMKCSILVALILNVIITTIIIYDMSREYLANIIM